MMTIRAKVRGHEGVFIFDTGGGISYISPAFAQAIGCKPWGQITGFTLTGQRLDMPRCDGLSFDIQGHRFAAPTFGVFDLMKYMPPDVPRIDGSIGLDVFAGRVVTLSLAEKRLTVESPSSLALRARRGKEVPIRLVREAGGVALAVEVAVPTPEGLAWMELDSGNGGANVIGKHIALLLKLDSSKKEPQPANFGNNILDAPAREPLLSQSTGRFRSYRAGAGANAGAGRWVVWSRCEVPCRQSIFRNLATRRGKHPESRTDGRTDHGKYRRSKSRDAWHRTSVRRFRFRCMARLPTRPIEFRQPRCRG